MYETAKGAAFSRNFLLVLHPFHETFRKTFHKKFCKTAKWELCRILERGLGCALIESTLGSGNPGRAGNLGGGRGNKGAMGDKGD
jgi:hypothetical protein